MAVIDRDAPLAQTLARQKILPVLTVADPGCVPALAEILRRHRLSTVEVTLRTPAALDVIAAFAKEGDFRVGAGTVRSSEDLARARQAGAAFAVAPGMTPKLTAAAVESPVPFIPAAATPSEMMALAEAGFHLIKFFPAAAMGAEVVKAVEGPLPELRFIANGGVGPQTVGAWLDLPNVLAVGMTAIMPPALIAERAFGEIARRVHAAVQALP